MNFLLSLIALIIGGAGAYLIKYLNDKIGQDKLTHYYQIAKNIVMSLEQVNPDMAGSDKKFLAATKLSEFTNGKISEKEAEVLIESAVYEVKKVLSNTINSDNNN
jgi:hypothetical protein